PHIWSLDRETQADEIRRLSAAPDVMLGSVHAVTESGALLAASMSGSQLGPYASGAGRVILVVGTQKIVSDLEEGLRRINDYSFPLEDARAQAAYGIRSAVNKVLIINREIVPERFTVVLVDEALRDRELVGAALAAGKAVYCEWPLGGATSTTHERWPRWPPSRECAPSSVCKAARPRRSGSSTSCSATDTSARSCRRPWPGCRS